MSSSDEPFSALPPPPRHPFTGARIETMVSRAIVGFGVVFGVLVIPQLLAQQVQLMQPFAGIQAGLVCAGLLAAVVTAALRRGVRTATSGFAVLYLFVVVLWPLTASGTRVDGTPWLWMLCTVASAYAAVGMPTWVAAAYAIIAPALFGVVMWELGTSAPTDNAVLDAVYSAIVGSVILTIATMLRGAAARVDVAQRAALDGYEHGVREHLGEAERVEVDALVHDSVLATLLAAAGARTPDAEQLAARMAQDALGHLSSSKPLPAPHSAEVTDAWTLLSGIRAATAQTLHQARFATHGLLAAAIPVVAAEALQAATVQAMLNSSQHAGGHEVSRTVTMRGLGDDGAGGVQITIVDDGVGFDIARVGPRRLGLANSIVGRMEIVGGTAVIESAPGAGTSITLRWPAHLDGAGEASAPAEGGVLA
ncbi:sensor histidine kinase [Gryllotalpicola reticulitermitis]|uniref:Sensor histidine kinase n=1 Tax=Gryllotalpicola reticulitermitis TaxID=1184153 RepID=A0ABV8Q8I7_9MICO